MFDAWNHLLRLPQVLDCGWIASSEAVVFLRGSNVGSSFKLLISTLPCSSLEASREFLQMKCVSQVYLSWIASTALLWFCAKGQDEFEWFRCDACSASFFKVNKTLMERHGHRSSLSTLEFVEILEQICSEEVFTKHEYGVKQYEGKKYLFGPGIADHIPGKGFGQMGMGDYDMRLQSYC
eukprot:1448968-Amphidinium_carterae.1